MDITQAIDAIEAGRTAAQETVKRLDRALEALRGEESEKEQKGEQAIKVMQ